MVVKVYISGISASQEVKSYQQRAQFVLDSLKVNYESIDITDPEHETIKEIIKIKCKYRNNQLPKTPQFFNDDIYCGDWFDFEIANDEDRVLEWLGLEVDKIDESEKTEDNLIQEIESNENNFDDFKPKIDTTTLITEKKCGNDLIITEETIVTEESIIFGNENIKTIPEYVKISEENQKYIGNVNLDKDKEIEEIEEICILKKNDQIDNQEDDILINYQQNQN